MRQLKREVKIGNVTIGGKNPIAVQTMLNVPVEDIEGNVAQAKRCEAAGCQILRVTCPSAADAKCIEAVKNAVNIPIVADIHFDYKAAIACADVGVDKIRINPGNIGDDDRVKAVVDACQQKNIPIRIGVNGGSLEKHILAKYGAPVPEAMVESALYHVRLLEKFDFNNIVISIKNSNVPRMMEAYRQLSAVTDYPLHVGVTEAGTYQMGLLKSGMGIGGMLLEGIGDTIRVSLAADPEKEVEAGYNILRAVGFPVAGPEVITCPTCGRTQYPCTEIANEVERRLQGCKKSIKVAVMGCVVNGPGEAREADIGIAGGKGEAVLFVHGNPVKKLTGDNILDQFMEEIYKLGRGSLCCYLIEKEYHCDTTCFPAMAAVYGGPGLCGLFWPRGRRARPDAAAGAAGHLYAAQFCPAGQGAVRPAAGLAGTGLRGLRTPHQQSFRLCDAG